MMGRVDAQRTFTDAIKQRRKRVLCLVTVSKDPVVSVYGSVSVTITTTIVRILAATV